MNTDSIASNWRPQLRGPALAAIIASTFTLTLLTLTLLPALADPGPTSTNLPPVGAGGATPAAGESGTAAVGSDDPRVQALLDNMAKAYQALTSYSDTIRFLDTVDIKAPDAGPVSAQTNVKFRRPDQLSAEMTIGGVTSRVVSDGHHLYFGNSVDRTRYWKLNAPPPEVTLLGAAQLSHVNMGLLPYLFNSADPLTPFRRMLTSLTIGAATDVDGTPAEVLTGSINPAAGVTGKLFLAIGRDDHLLRRVTVRILTPANEASTVTETHTSVRVNPPLESSAFGFPAPAGAVAVTSVAPPLYNPDLVVGANPIPFEATDLDGKHISPARMAGKVVLLNFWASWAGPARKEIPNIVSIYKRYHRQGLEVIGISLDYAGGKSEMLDYMKENNMTWPEIFDGKVWDGAVPALYKVEKVPLNIVIGRDGKLAAVDLLGPALETAVQQAIEKK